MTDLRVIGIDPGTTTGIIDLRYFDVRTSYVQLHRVRARQATDRIELEDDLLPLLHNGPVGLLAVERFVVARGSMRGGAHGRRTAELVGEISAYAGRLDWTVVQRSASQAKTWATDTRLEAAGLLEACKGMRHARDAARHALFAAVHDGGIPDPLSKVWVR